MPNQQTPTLSYALRIKLVILVNLSALIITLISGYITSWNYLIIQLILWITVSTLSSTAIIYLLNPLYLLFQAAIMYNKNEFKHVINLSTNDEFGNISALLNKMGQNLHTYSDQINYDKQLLQYEKNKLEAVISSIGDAIIVLNLHKQVIMVNKALEELTGFTQAEIIGKNIDQIIVIKDDKGQQIQSKDFCPINLTNPDQPSIPYTSRTPLTLVGKNNHISTISLKSSHINSPIQFDLGCVLIIHSLNKEKTFQEMQIDFVSMASHELRTPLTSIIGYLSTLSEDKKNLNEIQAKFLERALVSSKQLYSLVENLLNVSKVERNAFTMNFQPIDYQKNLQQIVEDNKSQAIEKNITLELNLSQAPLPQVKADNLRINEVLNNLISNSIKYTQKGGTIKIRATADNEVVTTSISDNGIGIPKEAIPHLFTKFYRAPGSLDQMAKGTGLGLFISKSIIDLHHGKIWVESEQNKGSTFYFTLPIAKTEIKQSPTIAQLHSFTLPN